MKALIVYYSYGGNTRRIAQRLQKELGCDLAEIETVTPYTDDYNSVVDQGQREVESGFMPELKPLPVDPAEYDAILVGTPTWWYTMAPAVRTFLNAHTWQGKTVIPFMTNAGWPGHVIADMKKCCKGAKFICEKEIKFDPDGSGRLLTPESELEEWLVGVKDAIS